MTTEKLVVAAAGNPVLQVDLSTGTAVHITITEADRRRYLGGKGLGIKLLYDRFGPDPDPLGPDNWIALMPGVLIGTGAPCSARFAALTRSPLTGIMLSCSCGGPFGVALKSAGYDGLLITGRAAAPSVLAIDSEKIAITPAGNLWGLETDAAQAALSPGRLDGVLAIGPAGENLVRFANAASGHRFLGRGGLGAVMGAKRLKAVVARGRKARIVPAWPEAFKKCVRQANRRLTHNRFTAEVYHRYGTPGNLKICDTAGILPVNNFTAGRHPESHRVAGETMAERFDTSASACRLCPIRCGHKGTLSDGTVHQVPEFETVGLLGTNLGIFDPEQIVVFNDICNRLGMDTISAGATIAFIMEAAERGLIRSDLRFGRPEGIAEALEATAWRSKTGDLMAEGTRLMAEKIGGRDMAQHVKGLDMAAYDPRGAWGQGLAYAVANRGGCHLSAYLVSLEVFYGLLNPHTTWAKPQFVKFFEDLTCCINALHTCQFTMYAYCMEAPIARYTPKFLLGFSMQWLPHLALPLIDVLVYRNLWQAATGMRISRRAFLRAGARIHVLERLMNTGWGIRAEDDTLPPRFLHTSHDPRQKPVPLAKMLPRYYRCRGYDAAGIPTAHTLARLGIEGQPAGK